MSKVYLDIPVRSQLHRALEREFSLSDSLISADIIVTEDKIDFITGKLIIYVGDVKPEGNIVFIDKSLDFQTIFESIKASVAAFSFSQTETVSSSYHVIGDDDKYGELLSRFNAILNAMPESIVEIDLEGDIIFNNRKFVDIYEGETPVIEANFFDMLDPNSAMNIKSRIVGLVFGEDYEFNGMFTKRTGAVVSVSGHVTSLPGAERRFEVVFEDVTNKIAKAIQLRKLEEQAIIAGFSRHLSHNVMNALTAAGGFIRQVKSKTETSLHMQNLWHIIDGKLMLIEEIVAAYNDYTHALSLVPNEKVELSSFFEDLVTHIAAKDFDRKFSAYLYKFTENYQLEYDFSEAQAFETPANPLFLKLALCYVLKDNIRYFGQDAPIKYKITLAARGSNFYVHIDMLNVFISDHISETMFKPWDHQVKTQSFDYWGIMIANTILERHNGQAYLEKNEGGARFTFMFIK